MLLNLSQTLKFGHFVCFIYLFYFVFYLVGGFIFFFFFFFFGGGGCLVEAVYHKARYYANTKYSYIG